VARDLIVATRIADAAEAAGYVPARVDEPGRLPSASEVAVAFVDWADREPGWGTKLRGWQSKATSGPPRIVLFGPHTDLEAHEDARASGLGPMMARSKLFASLPSLLPR
jgi:hypothetical protein